MRFRDICNGRRHAAKWKRRLPACVFARVRRGVLVSKREAFYATIKYLCFNGDDNERGCFARRVNGAFVSRPRSLQMESRRKFQAVWRVKDLLARFSIKVQKSQVGTEASRGERRFDVDPISGFHKKKNKNKVNSEHSFLKGVSKEEKKCLPVGIDRLLQNVSLCQSKLSCVFVLLEIAACQNQSSR